MRDELIAIKQKKALKLYGEALADCNSALEKASSSEDKVGLLRARAGIYRACHRHELAYKDRMSVIAQYEARTEDYFDAALSLLISGEYVAAVGPLDEAIQKSSIENDDYFLETLYFFKAFALLREDEPDLDQVNECLNRVTDGFSMWIDPSEKPRSKHELVKKMEDLSHKHGED